MKRRVMRQEDVAEFCRYLQGEERSQGTIETYRREIRAFAAVAAEIHPTQESLIRMEAQKQKRQTMARHSTSIAGMMNSRAVSLTTILITRRWMQHMAKSEMLM